jgi:putative heme-binding domain-containing protein
LDPAAPGYWAALLEAHWVYEGLNVVDKDLLGRLLASPDHRVRAAGVRALYHRQAELPDAFDLLGSAIRDPNPRVRLEAVHALRQLGTAQAAERAMEALDSPVDENLHFALWLTAKKLAKVWVESYLKGEVTFGGRKERLLFALRAAEDPRAVGPLIDAIGREGQGEREAVELASAAIAYGDAEQLGRLFQIASERRWTGVLNELQRAAAQGRPAPQVSPSSLESLLDSGNAALAASAARLAGAWSMEELRERLEAMLSSGNPLEILSAAAEGLAALGGSRSRDFFAERALQGSDWDVRGAAAGGLLRVDRSRGATAIAAVFGEAEWPDAARAVDSVMDTVLRTGDAPADLAEALASVRLDGAVAAAALRRVETSGVPTGNLAEALRRAGGLEPMQQQLSTEALAALIEDVRIAGDPKRGEAVYRREALQCGVCHAIGGAGGVVGPDMISIGASAPVDYIIEALLNPNAKIKEGYHLTVLHLDGGDVRAGMIVREDANEIVLRDATGKEEILAVSQVERREITPVSMMPPGLTAPLRRDEFVDLTAFLAQLGKEGPFRVPARAVVRRWEVAQAGQGADNIVRQLGVKAFATGGDDLEWKPVYSTVAGNVPLGELPKVRGYQNEFSVLRFALDMPAAGQTSFSIADPTGLQLWVDGKEREPGAKIVLDLDAGRRAVTVAVDRAVRIQPLELELLESESASGARLVGGP